MLFRVAESSHQGTGGSKGGTRELWGDFKRSRIVRFGLASGIGFLVAEGILAVGVAIFFQSSAATGTGRWASAVLVLDAISFGTGVTIAFVINEYVTVRGPTLRAGWTSWLLRWSKYQASSLLGNVVLVGVQLVLLAWISLNPAIGSLAGAIISYPVTYLFSMRFVWGAPSGQNEGAGKSQTASA